MRKIQYMIRLGLLALCAVCALSEVPAPSKAAELPPECSNIAVPNGIKKSHRFFAAGSQIYRWNGSTWDFVAPSAELFADAGYDGKVGTHFAGPTWQSNSGSKVVARKIGDCTPDPSAIPWLLLEAITNDGPGMFAKTVLIQRVNTSGGLKPDLPGVIAGQEAWMPYTAEYVFFSGK
ncbi:MAG TPA: DUF3455 domain-containing protein [Pyrinomonadaceae bacterium]|nr:DUF3455 domain-containing protein [Pyrinomonadaceae bacterium]